MKYKKETSLGFDLSVTELGHIPIYQSAQETKEHQARGSPWKHTE